MKLCLHILPVAAVVVAAHVPFTSPQVAADEVPIVVDTEAATAVRVAADELAGYLGRLYPTARFSVQNEMPPSGPAIRVGSVASDAAIRARVALDRLRTPESYLVQTVNDGNRRIGLIAGADARGAVYGVYGLLKKLGCGFYLSYDAVPEDVGSFSFDAWELSDAPLMRERIVFDWHNFVSGCSTWNLEHWEKWIRQSQKAGYNGVMVHAYGNNPMVRFTFGGRAKPVGYLSTTVKGRDWSTQHVNDVRRLYGGSAFDGAIFGSEAAIVPDDGRADAARAMMNRAFATAENRAMNVYLAVDVDTVSANPQSLIETLPPEARFSIAVEEMRWMNQEAGALHLANPDTPAGHQYYKAQVETLLDAYPQIDCLVVWFRHNATPWMAMKVSDMPPSWQKEYQAQIERTPEAAELWRAHNFFALGKIIKAFDRALEEIGRKDVDLATGSWRFDFFPPADRFLPKHVKLIPLDYQVLHDASQMDTRERRQAIAAVGKHRPVVPVVWAHHDDGNYVGRPYVPYPDFQAKLTEARAAGFGIIHWTTRPLDLYFASLSEQVWRETENRPLGDSCREMASRTFGRQNRDLMGEYIERWVTDAPKIGRETGDRFIDRKLADWREVEAGSAGRIKLLDAAAARTHEKAAGDRIDYFRGMEQYLVDVHRTEATFREAGALFASGDLDAARRTMSGCRPESVIQRYAEFSQLGGMTRGEQGLIVSMNLRWLTHYVRFRQALGLTAVRYNFAPTSHDPLAQSMGTFTFHFAANREIWQCLGTRETGAATFVLPGDADAVAGDAFSRRHAEIYRTGIKIEKPITIRLCPIMATGGRGKSTPSPLAAGRYTLDLLMLRPPAGAQKQSAFDLVIRSGEVTQTHRVDDDASDNQRQRALRLSYEVEVDASGGLEATLAPVEGAVRLCGAILEPKR